MKKIWITWECQRRNRELSSAMDARFFELAEIDKISNPFRKYLFGLFKITKILLKEKPQNCFLSEPFLYLWFYLKDGLLSKYIWTRTM